MNEATRLFALAHVDDDVRQLALRGARGCEGVDMAAALQQVKGRQMAWMKLPSWAENNEIVYPPHINMEQCSSEATAQYKARLAQGGNLLLDLTGGFGVDFAFMCQGFGEGVYVEKDRQLFDIVKANLSALFDSSVQEIGEGTEGLEGLDGTESSRLYACCGDGLSFLRAFRGHASLIFLDPARRDSHGGRTFALADCTPDVLPVMDMLLRKADRVMLKLSPMLDWRKAVADVGAEHVEQVHIVAVGGECKELLLLLSERGCDRPLLVCANDGRQEVFMLEGSDAAPTAEEPPAEGPSFLYEPHAALMKGGRFAELGRRYGVRAVSRDSHLYLSDRLVENFPGRVFRILDISTMQKGELRQKVTPLRRANIATRNFPMTVDALRRKLRLADGGDSYLFATTAANGDHLLFICNKA